MYQNKKIVAVIPARGGSKRIPRKNIVDLGGKPLLAYSIEVAKAISEIDKIIVSSESDEILKIASAFGSEILERPVELSLDDTGTEPVLVDIVKTLESRGELFDYLILLEPTSPLRKADTVKKMIAMTIGKGFDSMGTVIEEKGYFWKQKDENWLPVFSDASRRSQERSPMYKEAGVCYIMKVNTIRDTEKIFTGKIGFIIVDEIEGKDINTPLDMEMAEFFISKNL